MKRITKLICSILFLSACGTNGYDSKKVETCFTENGFQIDSFETKIPLKGEVLIPGDSISGLFGPICTDDYIVFYTQREGYDNIFYVYDGNGKLISSFGKIGKANNEISLPVINNQVEGNSIWVKDAFKDRLCLINIESSIKNNKLEIDKMVGISGINNVVYISSNLVLNSGKVAFRAFTRANVIHGIYDPTNNVASTEQSNDTANTKPLYKDLDFKKEASHDLFQGSWQYVPNKNMIVESMSAFNQINFMDTDGNNRKSVIIGKPTPIGGDGKKERNGMIFKNNFYYNALTASSDKLYAMYMNQPQNDYMNKPKPIDIHVFSLDGEPLYQLEVPEYIWAIGVNEKDGYLYARSVDDECLMRYSLPN